MDNTPLTIGAVAERLGVQPWQVRRLYERGLLPPAARVGAYRVVAPSELPVIRRALVAAGYLPKEVAHA
jgi:DNA-binding transcriptional MerR regulator